MKKKIDNTVKREYGDKPYGRLKRIDDMLPPPEELLPPDKAVKVTLVLDEKTVKFFKESAKKSGQKYQRLIRAALKGYATKYG